MQLTLTNILFALNALRISQEQYVASMQVAKTVKAPSGEAEAAAFTEQAVIDVKAILENTKFGLSLLNDFAQEVNAGDVPLDNTSDETFNSVREERNMLFICNCSLVNSMEGCNAYRTIIGAPPKPKPEESSPEIDNLRKIVPEEPNMQEDLFFLGYVVPDDDIPSAGMNLPMSLWHLCDFAEVIEYESLADFLIVASL